MAMSTVSAFYMMAAASVLSPMGTVMMGADRIGIEHQRLGQKRHDTGICLTGNAGIQTDARLC